MRRRGYGGTEPGLYMILGEWEENLLKVKFHWPEFKVLGMPIGIKRYLMSRILSEKGSGIRRCAKGYRPLLR